MRILLRNSRINCYGDTMDISKKEIISDLRIYESEGVSRDHGRKVRDELEAQGLLKPRRTPTGRCLLSVKDAELLAENL